MVNDASATDPGHARTPERWARLRFAVVGPLLAAPPAPGEPQHRLRLLAAQSWRHPVSGQPVQFGVSTLERWYYAARDARDPLEALSRKIRSDHGHHPTTGSKSLPATDTSGRSTCVTLRGT